MNAQHPDRGKRVLVIDDEQMMLDAVAAILEDMGHSVECCASSVEGERIAIEQEFDLILVDIRMPEKDGTDVIEAILKVRPAAVILVVTGYSNDPRTRVALDAGAKGLIRKPFDIGKVIEFLRKSPP